MLAAVLSMAACSPGGTAAHVPKPGPSPVALGEVRIGALFPTATAPGQDALRGAQLAVEVLNGAHPDTGLAGTKVARFVLDPADTGAGAPAAVDRLVGTDHVAALTGALDADATAAASERAERLSVPMVSGSASAAGLTGRSLRWFWRVGPSDRTYVEDAFAWLRAAHAERPKDRPLARLVVVHSDDQAGRDGAALVEKLAPQDVQITEDVVLPADGSDLTPEVQRLAGYAPDALLAIAATDDGVRLVRTMARAGYTPPVLLGLGDGFTDPRFAAALGPLANAVVTSAPWSPEVERRSPAAVAVASAFRTEFGADMTADSARDFEAVLTIGTAIEAADSTDPSRLRARLAGMDAAAPAIMPWRGIKFDGTGQNTLAGSVLEQLSAGQYHVVYPPAAATASVVWPMPDLDKRS